MNPIIIEKRWEGELLREPIGINGFGYDPIFYLRGHDCSSAQLQPEVKNEISHRGQALSELLKQLLSLE
jgi:XTP/dITP diphosphohydrolase